MIGAGFPPAFRLLKKPQFDAVFATRRAAGGAALVLHAARNDLGHNRVGIVIGRKYGNAVARNRFRRLIREAFRTTHLEQPPGWDWVALPKKPPPPPPTKKGQRSRRAKPPKLEFAAIAAEFLRLARKLAR